MKQKIAVRAIIRKDQKTLLLRRATGRESIVGKYELPGGSVQYDEQPEDALTRSLLDEAGLSVQTAQLYDVLTYIDHDNRDIQYVIILYLVSLAAGGDRIVLSNKYNHYEWAAYAKAEKLGLSESTHMLLGISHDSVAKTAEDISTEVDPSHYTENTTEFSHMIVYSDGGSRGNPGPSASGFVIMDEHERVLFEGGEYLGITTNNQAEYHGVRLGLKKALEMGARSVDFRIDSLLVVNQMNGIYKIKNRDLWPINERIRELVSRFDKVTFTHVRREFNQLADGMVNKTLDAHANGELSNYSTE